jgi:hypothetical protein
MLRQILASKKVPLCPQKSSRFIFFNPPARRGYLFFCKASTFFPIVPRHAAAACLPAKTGDTIAENRLCAMDRFR